MIDYGPLGIHCVFHCCCFTLYSNSYTLGHIFLMGELTVISSELVLSS